MPSKKIWPKTFYYLATITGAAMIAFLLRNGPDNTHIYIIIYILMILVLGFNIILHHKDFKLFDFIGQMTLFLIVTVITFYFCKHDDTFWPLSAEFFIFYGLITAIPFLYKGYRDKLNESITANIYSPIIENILRIEGESLDLKKEVDQLEASKENMTFIYQLMKSVSEKVDIQEIFCQLRDILIQKMGISNLVIILRDSERSDDKTRHSLEHELDENMTNYVRYIENKVGHFFLLTNLSSYNLRIADDFTGFEESTKEPYESFVIIPFYMQKINKGFVGFFLKKTTDLREDVLNFAIFTVRNISLALNKVLLYEKIKKLSTIDGLTKLCLHRVFDDKLLEEFNRARRYRGKIVLVMMDIDHFKKFNDNYGHLVGDVVLQKVGNHILANCDQDITAARYGGEEFALICPTSLAEAAELTKRIKTAIQKDSVETETGEILKITISMGISEMTEATVNVEQLVREADEALYAAKHAGRDRIAQYPGKVIQTGI